MKTFLKVLKYICYFCSFPLYLIFAIIASINNLEKGSTYGLFAFVCIILPIVFTAIWLAIVIIQEKKLSPSKKPKNVAKKIKKQTAKQVAFSLLLACGVMFALDALLPMIFASLTSYTIYYEDVAESDAANNRADLNKEMLDTIVARAVLTGLIGENENGYTEYYTYYKTYDYDNKGNYLGNYTGRVVDKDGNPLVLCKYGYYIKDEIQGEDNSSYVTSASADMTPVLPAVKTEEEIVTMDKYFTNKIKNILKDGYKNEEVRALLDASYYEQNKNLKASINLSGYEAWCGPWVDLANDGRMTLPAILNLILGNRTSVKSSETYGAQLITDVDTREYVESGYVYDYPWYNPTTGKVQTIQISWTVLDMMGDGYTWDENADSALNGIISALSVDLSGLTGEAGLFALITDLELGNINVGNLLKDLGLDDCLTESNSVLGLINIPPLYYVLDSILTTVTYAVGNTYIAGTPAYNADGTVNYADQGNSGWMYGFAPLFLKLENADGSTVGVTDNGKYYISTVGDAPTQLGVYAGNYSKGTIDYMRFMWVDSNGLIFAITGLFAIRYVCYIFSGVTVLMAVAVGAIRMKLYRLDHPGTDGKTDDYTADENPTPEFPDLVPEQPQSEPISDNDVIVPDGAQSYDYQQQNYQAPTYYNN